MGCPFFLFFLLLLWGTLRRLFGAFFYFISILFRFFILRVQQTAGGIPFFFCFFLPRLFIHVDKGNEEKELKILETKRKERERKKKRGYKDKFEAFMNKHTTTGKAAAVHKSKKSPEEEEEITHTTRRCEC